MSKGVSHGLRRRGQTRFCKLREFLGQGFALEYWYWFLFFTIVGLASGVIDRWIVGPPILGTIFILATFLPMLSVSVRRLHDLDRSGWWVLLDLIPVVGRIILLIWFCMKGTDGPNRFGADRLARLGAN
jgi:uncharacterized membrane protein YhaH (DUF805 family)